MDAKKSRLGLVDTLVTSVSRVGMCRMTAPRRPFRKTTPMPFPISTQWPVSGLNGAAGGPARIRATAHEGCASTSAQIVVGTGNTKTTTSIVHSS